MGWAAGHETPAPSHTRSRIPRDVALRGGAAVCRIPVSNLLWRSVYFCAGLLARRMKDRVEFGTRSLVIANPGRKRIPRGICPVPSRDYSRQNSNFQGAGEEACACRHEYSSVGTSYSLGHNRHHHSWLIARDQTSQQS